MGKSLDLRGGLFVGGEVRHVGRDEPLEHVNPHTGQVQATVPMANAQDVDDAVKAARTAFPAWSEESPAVRRDFLLRVASLIREHGNDLVAMTTVEMGMPISFAGQASMELPFEFFNYYAGWCEKIEGSVIQTWPAPALDYTVRSPFGVIGVIIGWNGPMGSIGMKVAPALAAGNCVVIKPAELTPFSPLKFAEICAEAGLPPGVVNVVPGRGIAGDALARHPGVDKLTFTGGGATASQILDAAKVNLTPVVLELGGKSANIVFPDADVVTAVSMSSFMGAAALSGQACSLPTRLLLHEEIYDEGVAIATEAVANIVPSDPTNMGTVMGPLASAAQLDRVQGLIADAQANGDGKLLCGGDRLGGELANGFYLQPTLFGDVSEEAPLFGEEVFGPVLTISRFRDEVDAIRMANATRYGLAGYIWTDDVRRAHRVAHALEAGFVSVNGFAINPPGAPFGGWKASGWGKEGGEAGIAEFLRTKNIYIPID